MYSLYTRFADGRYAHRSVEYVIQQDPYYLLWRIVADASFSLNAAAVAALREEVPGHDMLVTLEALPEQALVALEDDGLGAR